MGPRTLDRKAFAERMSTPKDNAGENGAFLDGRRIPDPVIKRLSLYMRVLSSMDFEHAEKVSSAELARRLGLNSAQVRKDLAIFGQFGIPGVGYYVSDLIRRLREILGKDREVTVILIGVGNLGSALLSYGGFLKQGFTMLWGFDVDPQSARSRTRSEVPIFPINELEAKLAQRRVDLAVLAVPSDAAQPIATRLVRNGIGAILNFVPVHLDVPSHVEVRYVDLSLELESLSYYVQDE